MLGVFAAGMLASCSSEYSSTYYPQAKDEKNYRAKYGSFKDQAMDDQAAILQSHTDAHQGLNLPPDQPTIANDGLGWNSYR